VELAAGLSLFVTPVALAQVWGLAIIQGRLRFRSFNILRLVGGGLYSLGLIGVYASGQGTIVAAAAIWVLSSIVSCAVIWWVTWRSLGPAEDAAGSPPLETMYRFGLKSFLGSVFPVETFQLDQFYVGLALSPAALGLYVVGAALTNLTRFFLPQSVGAVAYPQVASAVSFAHARRSVWRFFAVTLVVCGIVVGILEVSVGWLLPVLFGRRFEGSVPVARILLLGSLFLAGRRVLAEATRGAGWPEMGAISEVVATVLAIPALMIASGSGLESVCWALTTAYGASLFLMVLASVIELNAGRSERRWASGASRELAGV
jgi:O-antigen/teichoic acid export membrane protein